MRTSDRNFDDSVGNSETFSLFSQLLRSEYALFTHIDALPKQTLIYPQEDKASSFYYLHSGLVGLYHMLDNGKICLIRIYHQGEFFGFRSLFGNTIYHCSSRVLKPAFLTRITPHEPQNFLSHFPDLGNYLLSRLASELGDSEKRLANMAYNKTLQRVLHSIQYLNSSWPEYVWTWREIAEYAGCETETAIRISRELKAKGYLVEHIK